MRPNFLSSGALLCPVVPTGRPAPSLFQPLILNLQDWSLRNAKSQKSLILELKNDIAPHEEGLEVAYVILLYYS